MSKFRLVAYTQDWENYGDAETPRWKPKGGSEFVIAELSLEDAAKGYTFLRGLVEAAAEKINYRDDMFDCWMIDWELLGEGELTPFERDQMRFDGRIDYPPRKIEEMRKAA